jgi:hypothetical protein
LTIRSKHSNLLNYFIHDKRDLSPAYVRSCEKFLKEISAKHQAASRKRQATSNKQQALDKTGL